MNLNESVCVVTGAARGIGLAIAEALLVRGAAVGLLDLDATALKAAVDALPSGKKLGVVCDVTSGESVANAVERCEGDLGPVRVWINNAGMARHRWISDYSEADIDQMLAVNLKGTILGSQAALRAMIAAQSGGHIVNIISTASLRGIPSETVYCAAKWGVRGFTQGLAEEAAAHSIRVTALLPGGVATDFWAGASDRPAPMELFLQPSHVAAAAIQCLEMDDFCVPRELVVRSMKDSDFSVKPS